MNKHHVLIVTISTAVLAALGACADEVTDTTPEPTGTRDDTSATEPTAATTTADQPDPMDGDTDISSIITEVQADLMTLVEEIRSSRAGDRLEEAWGDIEARTLSALETIADQGSVDGSELQDDMEAFQSTLDSLGDDVEDEVRQAWADFRSSLEQLTG